MKYLVILFIVAAFCLTLLIGWSYRTEINNERIKYNVPKDSMVVKPAGEQLIKHTRNKLKQLGL